MGEFLHVDLLNLVALVAGIIVMWTTLRNDSKWHTAWIRKHDTECDEQRKVNSRILTELQTANAHLATLSESHGSRIERIENQMDHAKGAAK